MCGDLLGLERSTKQRKKPIVRAQKKNKPAKAKVREEAPSAAAA